MNYERFVPRPDIKFFTLTYTIIFPPTEEQKRQWKYVRLFKELSDN